MAGVDTRDAREVRTVWTSEFGMPRPAGLTFDPGRGELLVAETRGVGIQVLRLNLGEESRGTFRVPGVTSPETLAFDPTRGRLTVLRDDELLGTSASGRVVSRKDVAGVGLGDPVASTFDPTSGTWFVLDDAADSVVRIPRDGPTARTPLGHLGASRFGGMAFNPSDGLLYVADVARDLLYGIDRAGRVRTAYRLASLDLRSPRAMTFAPSADRTDDADTLHLYVADAGDSSRLGGVMEISLAAEVVALAAEPNVVASLVQTIDTSSFTPGSPDPSGITYIPATDHLMVADSEVDETTGAGFHGVNLWKTTRTGTVVDTGDLTPYTKEPTGLGFDAGSNTLFISTDSGDRIYVTKPGGDGRFGTTDDQVTFINTGALGSGDTEDPEFDPASGHLFFIDGVSTEVFRIDPVDGVFGNGNDLATHFDVGQFGANDVEGLGSDATRDTLLVGDRGQKRIYEVTKTGEFVRLIDVSGIAGLRFVSGLSMAPASNAPGRMNYWIVDRAIDNGANANENDGKIFEVSVPTSGDFPPTVSITSPADGATVSGTIQIQANASDVQGVTQVQFFVGTTSIGTDTDGSNGWSIPWNSSSVGDGPRTITATATDTIGQTGSDTNLVTVDNIDGPPTVSITDPVDGGAVTGTVQIQANASDDKGVTQVQFLDGGNALGTDTNGSNGWSVSWNTAGAAEGLHSITAIATDTIGQTGSDTNAVTVDHTPPSVSITSPNAGATLSGTVAVEASASDASGVGSVVFRAGTTVIGSDTNAADGWSVPWNTTSVSNGPYGLTATATDVAGNPTTSASVPVTIDNPLVVEVPVSASLDDVEERSNGSVNATSADLELLLDGTNLQRAVGLRFAGVNVPEGANVVKAYVQFQADETSSDGTNLVVRGQAADNAAPFATTSFNVTNRVPTTASIPWTPPAWTQVGARGLDQRTPQLDAVLEEIFDRSGWAPGNAVVLTITGSGRRIAEAFDGTFAPVLHIEYGPGDPEPTVSITSPADGAAVSGTVQVQANASDDKGVTQVRFFDGATPMGTDTDGSNGWSVSWNTAGTAEGPHTITATATDTIGQTGSDSITVTVDNVDGPPNVSITSPADGATVSGTMQVQANASDDKGVTQVRFFDGATPIGTDTDGSNGWSVSWNTSSLLEGNHDLTAVATDTANQTTTSAVVNVTVDNTSPTVTLTSPAAGTTVSSIITVQANASDASGVASVMFLRDGATAIGTDADGSNGWSISWNSASAGNGSHELTAVAVDIVGNTATSPPVQVTVDNPLVLDLPIAAGPDDVEEKPNGNILPASSDLDIVTDNQTAQRGVGLRFTGIDIPQGATIVTAYVQFQTDKATSVATTVTIQGEAADNAPAFAAVKFNLTNRVRTNASILWTPPVWTTVGARGPAQRTADLGAVLDEIFARPGWAPGNAIVLVLTGTGERVAEAFDGTFAPVLHIEYATD
jgi:hypothetical protein